MILILSFIGLNVQIRADLNLTYPLALVGEVLIQDVLAVLVGQPAFSCHLIHPLSLVLVPV